MENRNCSVQELVQKILSGELRLPEMQRRYVWTSSRVRDLLDSLYRGYPTGAILAWDADGETPDRHLAVEHGTGGASRPSLLLLDGQQRLTSLAAVLEGKPITVRDKRKPVEILFNLDHPEGPPAEVTEVDDQPEEVENDDGDEVDDEDSSTLLERLQKRTFVVATKALEDQLP